MSFIVGVDCHKQTHAITVVDQVGAIMLEFEIAATPVGYAEAIKATATYPSLVWGLEGTGCYGRSFAQALEAAGFEVYEVPGNFTKRHRKHASSRGKSDRNDARAIAEAVLRERDRLPKFVEFEEQEALRLRHDQRDRLVRERTMLVNRMQHAALRLGVEPPGKLTMASNIATFREMLVATNSSNFVQDALLDDLRFDLARLDELNAEIGRIENIIRPFVKRLAPELLHMTGVSFVTAAGLIGHTGNLDNLRNADAFAMRTGTAPISWASGKNQSVRLNTGGNRQLNRMFHTIALTQIRTAGHPGNIYFDRKRAEGKTRRAALRALKRKLSDVVYFRLKLCQQRLEQPLQMTAA